jgi:hypothetical protein
MIDEAHGWDVFRSQERTARKDHICGECGRPIAKGERYHWATGLADGRWDTFRMCGQCHASSRWLLDVCGGWLYHGVREELLDHWMEDYLYRSLSFGRVVIWSGRSWKRPDGSRVPVETVKTWVRDALARVLAVNQLLEADRG